MLTLKQCPCNFVVLSLGFSKSFHQLGLFPPFENKFHVIIHTSVACAINPSVNSLDCRVDTTYVIILQGILMYLGKIFPTTPKAHHNSFYLNSMVGIQVLSRPQLIFPSKTWFFGIYLNFQWQKSIENQYLPHSESKSYQMNSVKSCSSTSFQQHQRHIPIPPKFSATI